MLIVIARNGKDSFAWLGTGCAILTVLYKIVMFHLHKNVGLMNQTPTNQL
jgi:hypothetical protein